MEKTHNHFNLLFTKELLKEIKIYNINEKYLAFDPEHKWVVEGGVEFIFDSYTLSLGWHNDMQLYELIEGDIKGLTDDLDIYEMDLGSHPNIEKIRGKKIENLAFNWTWYQKMNEDMEPGDEKTYIPQEIKINFEDGTEFQVATVVFQIKDKQMHKPVYDSQSTLLITVDQPVEIMEAEY